MCICEANIIISHCGMIADQTLISTPTMKLLLWPDLWWRKPDHNGNRDATPVERSVHGGTFYCIVISHCTVVNIMQLFPSARRCRLKRWTSHKSVWQLKTGNSQIWDFKPHWFWMFLALGSQRRSGGKKLGDRKWGDTHKHSRRVVWCINRASRLGC